MPGRSTPASEHRRHPDGGLDIEMYLPVLPASMHRPAAAIAAHMRETRGPSSSATTMLTTQSRESAALSVICPRPRMPGGGNHRQARTASKQAVKDLGTVATRAAIPQNAAYDLITLRDWARPALSAQGTADMLGVCSISIMDNGRADLGILRGKTVHESLIWYPGTHAGLIICGLT